MFLSVDSRAIPENPLYRTFRAKTFTDRDIMLHFHLLDMLSDSEGMSISGIMEELTDRLSEFDDGELPDESTVRKKLKEYVALGLLQSEKRGRETRYTVSRGETYIQKDLLSDMMYVSGILVTLTKRERELLDLIAEHLPNEIIAERLGLSKRSVENYVSRIFDKFNVKNRYELGRYL